MNMGQSLIFCMWEMKNEENGFVSIQSRIIRLKMLTQDGSSVGGINHYINKCLFYMFIYCNDER